MTRKTTLSLALGVIVGLCRGSAHAGVVLLGSGSGGNRAYPPSIASTADLGDDYWVAAVGQGPSHESFQGAEILLGLTGDEDARYYLAANVYHRGSDPRNRAYAGLDLGGGHGVYAGFGEASKPKVDHVSSSAVLTHGAPPIELSAHAFAYEQGFTGAIAYLRLRLAPKRGRPTAPGLIRNGDFQSNNLSGWVGSRAGIKGTMFRRRYDSGEYAATLRTYATDFFPLNPTDLALPFPIDGSALEQQVDTPRDPAAVSFEYLFPDPAGTLAVYLGGTRLGAVSPSDAVDPASLEPDGFRKTKFDLPKSLLGRNDLTLEFRLTGAGFTDVQFDNVAFTPLPEPTVFPLTMIGLAANLFRRARR